MAKFIEVELEESYGVFFVDMIEGDKERAYRCTCCGEVFDATQRDFDWLIAGDPRFETRASFVGSGADD